MRPTRPVLAALVGVLTLTACSTADAGTAEPLVLTSPDLADDGTLPAWASGTYASVCDGENRAPALAWDGGPDDVASWLLTFTDPAHPDYVHWVVTGIPGDVDALAQAEQGDVGVGVTGRSYRGDGLYAGPCVPGGTYVYTLYALDEEVVGEPSTTLDEALALAEGHVLAEATLEVVPSES